MVFPQYPRLTKVINKSQDAHCYSCVSNIEGGPSEELKTDKVDCAAKADAVY